MLSKLKWIWILINNEPHHPDHYYMDGKWWTPDWSPEDEFAWQASVFADYMSLAQVQEHRRFWLKLNGGW